MIVKDNDYGRINRESFPQTAEEAFPFGSDPAGAVTQCHYCLGIKMGGEMLYRPPIDDDYVFDFICKACAEKGAVERRINHPSGREAPPPPKKKGGPMTDDQWTRLRDAIDGTLRGHAELRIDGLRVALERRLIGKNRLATAVFLDGEVKAAWLRSDSDHEYTRRFARPRQQRLFRGKHRETLTKWWRGLKKADKKRFSAFDPDRTIRTYDYVWYSWSAMKKHFAANNEIFELIHINDRYEPGMEPCNGGPT